MLTRLFLSQSSPAPFSRPIRIIVHPGPQIIKLFSLINHEDSVSCPGFHLVRCRIGASANEGCQDHSDCQGTKSRWHGRHGTGCCHDDDVMGYSKGSRARKYLFPRDRGYW
jgi:hypothetical protein